ncbi:MAG: DUF711 domain-containing protein [Thermoplasmata archaeon HGW-Thermoplasmata-1]|nr:MAG: DUF711 domain-containing protein [Thermoplasmata archaeon HGW-Thermoplasmata-1]
MKIRTITTGVEIEAEKCERTIADAAAFNLRAKRFFETGGYDVQEPRITTQPHPFYLEGMGRERQIEFIRGLMKNCKAGGVSFFNIGCAENPDDIEFIPEILRQVPGVFACASIVDGKNAIDCEAAGAAADAVREISMINPNGSENLRFAAIANVPADTPFFPGSYHASGAGTCFSIGLECGDLLHLAFSGCEGDLETARANLARVYADAVSGVEAAAEELSAREGIAFKGIDVSTAPSLSPDESVAYAFERLGFGKFGTPGTLTIAGMVTGVLKSLDVKRCGFSGLMIPVLEDAGLAERFNEGTYDIEKLLFYSAVCGTGIDCVPLPGDVPSEKIRNILLDVATLSTKLKKPLSARLFPIPGKVAGEFTNLGSPYLIDCKIAKI